MNITIVYQEGNVRNIQAFYRGLMSNGFRVCVIFPRKVVLPFTWIDSCSTRSSEKGVAVHRLLPVDLICKRNYKFGYHPIQFKEALCDSNPNLIHVLNEYFSFPLAQAIYIRNRFLDRHVPVLAYLFQNIDYLNLHGGTPRTYATALIRRMIAWYNLRHLSGATASNDEAITLLKNYAPHVKAQKIMWGIDTSIFFPKNQAECRRKLHLPTDKKIVGYFGRMVREKGLKCLVEAVAKLRDIYLVLVGEGDYLKEARSLVRQLSINHLVHFRPSVAPDGLNDYFNSLDCFVLASETTKTWKEQYGQVLVEAMSCGIPVIGSSSGVIPEILKKYPKHVIFEEKNANALTQCIKTMISRIFQSDHVFHLQEYSMENFASRHADFYKSFASFSK